jgi:glycosyltransferase involved in cell wall biosynthesis
LYICHNHPAIRPGGVETYTLELYEAMRAAGAFEPLLLAAVRQRGADPAIEPAGDDPNQYFVHTDSHGYDAFLGTSHDKRLPTRTFRAFLERHRPEVVHFQHTLFLGYDLIREVRNTLPSSAVVYTLHEYVPICHNNGQMVRTMDGTRCLESSPVRCHECFPDITPQAFLRRRRFIESHLASVDLFVAPSRFLRDRYVDWGVPPHKILYEEYGRRAPARRRTAEARGRRRAPDRFGFFGQLSAFKGVDVLLRAMHVLQRPRRGRRSRTARPRLWIHGANLAWQPKAFQHEFQTLVEATASVVTAAGAYDQRDLPRLMKGIDWVVVPSVWWENSPLVIQEAFLHGRPVICSDIGAMVEKVAHGVTGLHFRAGDPNSLARTMRRAAGSWRLWRNLRAGITGVHGMDAHVTTLASAYRALLGDGPGRA